MERELILGFEYFKVSKEQLQEAKQTNDGKIIVSGIMQRAEAKNQNGRIYPRRILEREVGRYTNNFINEKRALGELDHPNSSVVNLNNVSHNVISLEWKGDDLYGKVEILPTPSGKILEALLSSGITVGISSRGMGSVKKVQEEGGKDALHIQDDFELVAFDFVSNPSTHKAFMYQVNESVNPQTQKITKINELITNIITNFNE